MRVQSLLPRTRYGVFLNPPLPYPTDPQVTRQGHADGTATWWLFHIGGGTGGNTKNCTASVTEDAAGSSLHVASSPNGPWTPAAPLPSCNNPSQFLHPNGTFFIVCNGFKLYRSDNIAAGVWVHVVDIRATIGKPIAGNCSCVVLRGAVRRS